MIAVSILASAGILGTLLSYQLGQNKGYRAGNRAGELFEQILAERDGWHAAYTALLDSYIPEDKRAEAINLAESVYDAAMNSKGGGGG
jgi:hypothetical protein